MSQAYWEDLNYTHTFNFIYYIYNYIYYTILIIQLDILHIFNYI